MKIDVVGTGSSGNCYLIHSDDGRVLILDAGVPIMEVKKALNFNISCIDGVIVTHKHADHFKYAKDFEKMGFTVWKPFENPDRKIDSKQIGLFGIKSFDLPHDGTETEDF